MKNELSAPKKHGVISYTALIIGIICFFIVFVTPTRIANNGNVIGDFITFFDYLDENANEMLDVDLYRLNIQIDLEGHDVWRRVYVPSTYSFRHLHNIIQSVFDWQNYHLHVFAVERGENKQLVIVMDDDPETTEFLDPEKFAIRQERFVELEEVFPKYSKVIYEYDFGDSWVHSITLEKVEKASELRATFLDGNGERPPEDVGGLPGYEEYLRIMANEDDPRHHEIKVWAESQKERKLSHGQMNERLKSVFGPYNYSPHWI